MLGQVNCITERVTWHYNSYVALITIMPEIASEFNE